VREVSAPPLGVSMSESIDAGPTRAMTDAAMLRVSRVETCDIPPYFANDAAGPAVMSDLAYGDDDHQRYDLALPEGTPKALVVIVHGGGWTAGTKALFRPTIRSLSTIGYAAASIEYRLARDDRRKFPAGLADVRCGIRAARARAGVAKLVILGASSGGHLAAMVATQPNATEFDGECPDRAPIRVDGAILYYAPLELDQARERYIPKMRQAVDELLYGAKAYADGGIDETTSDWMYRARTATPSHAINGATPAMLLLHGGSDNIVPIQDPRDFTAALQRAGVPALLVEVPDQGHGFPVLGRKAELRPASCSVLHFLEEIAAR